MCGSMGRARSTVANRSAVVSTLARSIGKRSLLRDPFRERPRARGEIVQHPMNDSFRWRIGIVGDQRKAASLRRRIGPSERGRNVLRVACKLRRNIAVGLEGSAAQIQRRPGSLLPIPLVHEHANRTENRHNPNSNHEPLARRRGHDADPPGRFTVLESICKSVRVDAHFTVTVTLAVVRPNSLVEYNLYVVVNDGLTTTLVPRTAPTVGEMMSKPGLLTFQCPLKLKVTGCPAVTDVGEAVKSTIVGAGPLGTFLGV